ncbi:MAG TPA: hypothetical protein PKD55_25450, partial [Bellilinea sp.]|nr:hypothetical protein [Bellilinea sp.]
ILKGFLGKIAGLAIGALLTIVGLNIVQVFTAKSGDALAQTSLSLLLGLYRPLFTLRFVILLASVGVLIVVAYRLVKEGRDLNGLITPVYLACLLALVSEILGRFIFYASHVRLGI